jgi:sulfate adenylyltransferase
MLRHAAIRSARSGCRQPLVPFGARAFSSSLQPKIDKFAADVAEHLPADGKGVAFASAWLTTDNVIVSLFKQATPAVFENMSLVGVDTLHLFPTTYDVQAAVEGKYGKLAHVTKPLGCENTEDFNTTYGNCEELHHGDFDMHSKVEPFKRALGEVGREFLVTGRRMDQGEKRTDIDIFEPDSKIFNPLADWSWDEVIQYVTENDVPYNKGHHFAFRAGEYIDPLVRHEEGLPWEKVDLGKPFWECTAEEIQGDAAEAYIFKSFGDMHTTVPVYPHMSERAGRFVRVANTECGIHTRNATPGGPHGGNLVNLLVDDSEKAGLVAGCEGRVVELTERQACDVELISTGGFSPLRGFMTEETFDHVLEEMRLPEQQLWGMPVVLDVAEKLDYAGKDVLLRYNGEDLAVLHCEDVYKPDKVKEAKLSFGTSELEHPGVASLALEYGEYYMGGGLSALAQPTRRWHHKTAAEIREELAEVAPGKNVIAFQNRNPIHQAHYQLIARAPSQVENSVVLVHPTCGPTQPGDIESDIRILTYKALEEEVQNPDLVWAYLPYSMKMAGPREVLQHMIIRKNFGSTHFIIGRDMAGTKSTITGEDYYGPYEAHELAAQFEDELALTLVKFENVVYTDDEGYMGESEAKEKGLKPKKLSGTEFRRLMRAGEEVPEWFAFKCVIDVLQGKNA